MKRANQWSAQDYQPTQITDSYRATPAVTQDLSFFSLIWKSGHFEALYDKQGQMETWSNMNTHGTNTTVGWYNVYCAIEGFKCDSIHLQYIAKLKDLFLR